MPVSFYNISSLNPPAPLAQRAQARRSDARRALANSRPALPASTAHCGNFGTNFRDDTFVSIPTARNSRSKRCSDSMHPARSQQRRRRLPPHGLWCRRTGACHYGLRNRDCWIDDRSHVTQTLSEDPSTTAIVGLVAGCEFASIAPKPLVFVDSAACISKPPTQMFVSASIWR